MSHLELASWSHSSQDNLPAVPCSFSNKLKGLTTTATQVHHDKDTTTSSSQAIQSQLAGFCRKFVLYFFVHSSTKTVSLEMRQGWIQAAMEGGRWSTGLMRSRLMSDSKRATNLDSSSTSKNSISLQFLHCISWTARTACELSSNLSILLRTRMKLHHCLW